MILSCWYVVLFVYRMVLVFLQHNSIFRRVECLCMTLLDVVVFRLCGSWVDHRIMEAVSLLALV